MSKDRARILLAMNMKRIRANRGITGDQLAELADLTGNYIRKVETHRAWVKSETLGSLAKALRVPISELFIDKPNVK